MNRAYYITKAEPDTTTSTPLIEPGEIEEHMPISIEQLLMDTEVLKHKLDYMEAKSYDHTDRYVSREEIEPIKRLVYGIVSMVLLAVVASLISLVIKSP